MCVFLFTPLEWPIALSLTFFLTVLACLEIGFRFGKHADRIEHETAHVGTSTIEAAVFALLGLLIAFTFGGATARLDARRQMIVQEANAIGTAYLRLDLLPPADQPDMRRWMREYLDARLRGFDKLPDSAAANVDFQNAIGLQKKIWARAVEASRRDSTQDTSRVLLPALNDLIDITTTRAVALDTHLPAPILALLVSVALLSALLAGYAMADRKSRSWLHMILYSAVVAITLYTVLDLEFPRQGLIRLHEADRALIELRDAIK